MKITNIPLNQLVSKDNPRVADAGEKENWRLVNSIKTIGLISPITVDENNNIIAGHRRYAALKAIHGKNSEYMVPVVVRAADELVGVSVSENMIRVPMEPIDEAIAVAALVDQGHDVDSIASMFDRSVQWVRQRRALNDLPKKIKNLIRSRTWDVSMGEIASGFTKNQLKDLVGRQDLDRLQRWQLQGLYSEERFEAEEALFDIDTYPKALVSTDLFHDKVYLCDRATFEEYQRRALSELIDALSQEWNVVYLFEDEHRWEIKNQFHWEQPEIKDEAAEKLAADLYEKSVGNDDFNEDLADQYEDALEAARDLRRFSDEQKARLDVVVFFIPRDLSVEIHYGGQKKSDAKAPKQEKPDHSEPFSRGPSTGQRIAISAAMNEGARYIGRKNTRGVVEALVLAASDFDQTELRSYFHTNFNISLPAPIHAKDKVLTIAQIKELSPKFLIETLGRALMAGYDNVTDTEYKSLMFGPALRDHWTPDADYLNGYRKDELLEIVRAVCPESDHQDAAKKMGKKDLVKYLADGFAGKGKKKHFDSEAVASWMPPHLVQKEPSPQEKAA